MPLLKEGPSLNKLIQPGWSLPIEMQRDNVLPQSHGFCPACLCPSIPTTPPGPRLEEDFEPGLNAQFWVGCA